MTRTTWRIPGYRLDGFLGAGASGEVWRATALATGVAVALKRIPMRAADDRSAALSEAAVLSALDHPHLVRLHEVRHTDDALVLVLDLATGGSLADLLAARGRITPGEAITAVAPIAAAVAYAHAEGVVHGDITAANVLFTTDGLPLLADLGVARLLGSTAPARTTPANADPAVVSGGLPDQSSDVFMLGGLALHALTGRPPWSGDDAEEALRAAAEADCGADERLRAAGVPEPIAAVVARALATDPHDRRSAIEFALDLRHAGDPVAVELTAGRSRADPSSGGDSDRPAPGRPAFTRGARLPSPLPAPGSRHRRRRRIRPLLVGAGVAMLAAAAVAVWAGQSGEAHPAAEPRATGVAPTSPVPPVPRIARPSTAGAATTVKRPSPPRRVDRAAAQAVLDRLDSIRAAAYARRDVRLLSRVYAAPDLRARDTAALRSIVPAGCGLRGARTGFGHVRVVRRRPGAVWLNAVARLHASRLVCAGTVVGRAPGTAATVLRVELRRTARGWRVASQRPVGARVSAAACAGSRCPHPARSARPASRR